MDTERRRGHTERLMTMKGRGTPAYIVQAIVSNAHREGRGEHSTESSGRITSTQALNARKTAKLGEGAGARGRSNFRENTSI